MAKMLIINPPDFLNTIYEKNLFALDGLFVIESILIDKYPNLEYKTIDFDNLGLGIPDLFKEVETYCPDFVYLNLNSYSSTNFHLAVGIKKICPTCKIIGGLNIPKSVKNDFSIEIRKNFDYWLDIDLDSYKINSNISYGFKVFNKNPYYLVFFQEKNTEEIIMELNNKISEGIENFIFRETDNLSFIDFKYILSNLNEKICFIMENNTYKLEELKKLSSFNKKYKLNGIIVDLNQNPYSINYLRRLNIFLFPRIKVESVNNKLYDSLKNYNLLFIDIDSNDSIKFTEFNKYRYSELISFYLNDRNISDNLKFLLRHPVIFYKYDKFRTYLSKNKKIFH